MKGTFGKVWVLLHRDGNAEIKKNIKRAQMCSCKIFLENIMILYELQLRYLLYSICHPMLHISSQVKLEFPHRSFTSFTYSVCIFWQRTVLCAGQGYEIIILKLQRGKMILEYWFYIKLLIKVERLIRVRIICTIVNIFEI